jgi:hypothetical protein
MIKTITDVFITTKPYRYNQIKYKKIGKQTKNMLEKGVI